VSADGELVLGVDLATAAARVLAVDAATGEVARVRLNEGEVAALREQNERRLDELHRMFRSAGIDPVQLTTDAPQEILAAFLAWADRRMYTRGRKP
jgi:hypothetical protein